MKVTIEMDGFEERAEIEQMLNAGKVLSFLWEFQQHLRQLWKYEEASEVNIEELRERWYDLKAECGVTDEA